MKTLLELVRDANKNPKLLDKLNPDEQWALLAEMSLLSRKLVEREPWERASVDSLRRSLFDRKR